MNAKPFLAGAANVDVTPPLGTFINGDFLPHCAQYIHDQLHARALVLQQGGITLAIVVVDICEMPKDYVDQVKDEIVERTGIPQSHVLISSTHTHAAGSVTPVYLCAADARYTEKLSGLIVESVMLAQQRIRPAKIAWGSVDVPEHVLCRRYKMKPGYVAGNPVNQQPDHVKTNPFGFEQLIEHGVSLTDPQVSFLAVKGIDDKWISVVANYSLHYVGDWDSGTISSDYFGEFSRQLHARLGAGADFAGIMSNGTSGDINIWDFSKTKNYPNLQFEKSKLIGGDIAEKVFHELPQVEWETAPSLGCLYMNQLVKLRKPADAELCQARKILMESSSIQMSISDETLKYLYAREQVLLNDLPDMLEFPVQAIRIGSGMIGGLGAEIFAETGLWLKERSPVKNYFTICLANGNAGYAPPQHEFDKGGYETWRSRTSKLETGAESLIKNELLELLRRL